MFFASSSVWFLVLLIQASSIDPVPAFVFPKTLRSQQHDLTTMLSSATTARDSSGANGVDSQFWTFNGHECFYEVSQPTISNNDSFPNIFVGNKKNLEIILIHGFGCSTTYWRESKKYLTNAGYKVHALDLLGQGQSAKPGRDQGVEYSIDLWAEMVDSYAQQYIPENTGLVLMGNSLGSCVALAAATGDFKPVSQSSVSKRIQGLCLYNCGIGMNSQNVIKDPGFNSVQKALIKSIFDFLNLLIFDNIPLLTFLLTKVVTRDLLRNALVALYKCAPDPESRVTDDLVESFFLPAQDAGSIEALNQIYVNDAGKTPMEFHQDNPETLSNIPIHLIWGDEDNVTPISGPVGQFYTALAEDSESNVSLNMLNAGHIPFDEIPECNKSMIQWLEQSVSDNNQELSKPIFQWPFGQ